MPGINFVRFYTGKWGIESHSKILFSTYIISNNLDNIFPQDFFQSQSLSYLYTCQRRSSGVGNRGYVEIEFFYFDNIPVFCFFFPFPQNLPSFKKIKNFEPRKIKNSYRVLATFFLLVQFIMHVGKKLL